MRMSCGIGPLQWVIQDIAVKIQRLRVSKVCIRNRIGPITSVVVIGTEEPAHRRCVVPGAEVVVAGFGVSFFAGEVEGGCVVGTGGRVLVGGS